MDFSSFDKLEDLVKSYKDRRGGLCCRLVSNFVDPPDDYGPVIDYEDLFWDLSSESIVLGPKLGEGSFGTESVNYEIYALKYWQVGPSTLTIVGLYLVVPSTSI